MTRGHAGIGRQVTSTHATLTRTAILFAATALLVACQDSDPSPFPKADVTATGAQGGTTLSLRPGQSLEIRLAGNSSIYPPIAWSVAETPPNLRADGREVVADDPQAMGAGATWYFRFTAIGPGRGRLTFHGGESGEQRAFEIVVAG